MLVALTQSGSSELSTSAEAINQNQPADNLFRGVDRAAETLSNSGKQKIPQGKDTKLQIIPASWTSNSSYLNSVPKLGTMVPALDGFVPHIDKVRFPDSWDAFRKTFGVHIDWAIVLALLAVATWAYVRYVRPQLDRNRGGEFILDENDTTASLLLLPGETLLFRGEEPATQSW